MPQPSGMSGVTHVYDSQDWEESRSMATQSAKPPPVNKLAAKHTGCPCYLDPRCQIAVAFQEARDYWAQNPDDIKANARNEVHESIERWLVTKRILEGPVQTIPEDVQEDNAQEILIPASPSKRTAFRLPKLRPLRRLSLPNAETALAFPLSPTLLRRRHTDGETVGSPPANSGRLLAAPRFLRNVAVVFRSSRQKRPEALLSDEFESHISGESASTDATPSDTLDEESSIQSVRPIPDNVSEYAISVFEDASDGMEIVLSPVSTSRQSFVDSPLVDSPRTASPVLPGGDEASTHEDEAIDPAHAALMPILYELDALQDHPKHRAIAEEHHDENYTQFWEAFSQLSAKEVLYAVYAIRAGALDVPLDSDSPPRYKLVLFLFLWAIHRAVSPPV
ncbi:hypothetical protein BD413DRAFT_668756 [Trametes elegans]|nr:hypothetical protein BD413DRAFT_668756 [Trametes elegans]